MGVPENINDNKNRLNAKESDAESDHLTDSEQSEIVDEFTNDDSEKCLLEQKLHDTFAAVTDVLDECISECKENYQVGEYSTVDEMLGPFRGRYKFRQYIPSKPAKYGIKVPLLSDARTFYTINIEVYRGR
ncbi:hypothetical protein ILUMI_11001 [Ignelater luminosus]|uniref:PiggyBac transposable element-derived protein domain-containing protein n=1 Tax=Ignelater luminosus TaxID=2038154 RepID=A0A8K0D282_IGNLU|nr:hypothetical protein ILUMI_11001 [Ignelater luminosus]